MLTFKVGQTEMCNDAGITRGWDRAESCFTPVIHQREILNITTRVML